MVIGSAIREAGVWEIATTTQPIKNEPSFLGSGNDGIHIIRNFGRSLRHEPFKCACFRHAGADRFSQSSIPRTVEEGKVSILRTRARKWRSHSGNSISRGL